MDHPFPIRELVVHSFSAQLHPTVVPPAHHTVSLLQHLYELINPLQSTGTNEPAAVSRGQKELGLAVAPFLPSVCLPEQPVFL